jgi:hypothetical protein
VKKKLLVGFHLILLIASLSFYSCKKDETLIEKKSVLGVNLSQSPIPLGNIGAAYAANIKYGNYNGSTFDIFMPLSGVPTALVIFIHGGSFVAGDKTDAYYGVTADEIRYLLGNNIAFATINYPFKAEVGGVLGCFNEIKRCLQFIRYNNAELNIDKFRVGSYGGSAGGGSSIWLGFRDEMGDPSSNDPVLRESTRLQAVGHNNSQASYDPMVMEEIFDQVGVDFFSLTDVTETVFIDYNITNLSELTTNQEVINMRKELDMLGWMTEDDPEFYVSNINEYVIPTDKNGAVHHPLQGKTLDDQATTIGIVCNSFIPAIPAVIQTSETLAEFMVRKLN